VAKLRRHLDRQGFESVAIQVVSAENPSRSPLDSTLGRAVEQTAASWFPQPATVHPLMWATGPMFPIAQGLGIPICSPPGVGRPDSRVHAPNENARIGDFLDIVGFTTSYLRAYGQA
jgi:succinyl-diaminopimelate desuccinylase